MVTNQKIKKTLDEIKQITQKEVLLYSSKAKYVSGTDEAKEDYAILAERLIVSEEEYIIEESCAAFAVEIDGELEYVIIMPDDTGYCCWKAGSVSDKKSCRGRI